MNFTVNSSELSRSIDSERSYGHTGSNLASDCFSLARPLEDEHVDHRLFDARAEHGVEPNQAVPGGSYWG